MWRLYCWLLLAGLFVSALVMFALAALHHEVFKPAFMAADIRIQQAVHNHSSPDLTRLMFALTEIGSPRLLAPVIPLMALLLWWRGFRDEALLWMSATGGASLLTLGLKAHFHRLRPDLPWALTEEHSFSFPSGQSVFAVVVYSVLVYLTLRQRQRTFWRVLVTLGAMSLVFGIGYSRIYLGVHYPSDVLAGYLVGGFWVGSVIFADWYLRPSFLRKGRTWISRASLRRAQRKAELAVS